jgi:Skp family chaperone for outer membrane proteins
MKKLLFSLMLLSVLSLAGCQKSSSRVSSGVGIIDLDRVATAMGWLDDLQKGVQAVDAELRAQLEQVFRSNSKLIEDMKAEVAADAKLTPDQVKQLTAIQDTRDLGQLPLTKEQRDKLIAAVTRANTTWQTALNNSQQALQARRAALIVTYRERIRPVARRVAEARGLNLIVTTSDNVLYFDPQNADITNQVIDELQKAPAEAKGPVAAPAPTAPAPTAPASTGSTK